jgi:hypothetical protein
MKKKEPKWVRLRNLTKRTLNFVLRYLKPSKPVKDYQSNFRVVLGPEKVSLPVLWSKLIGSPDYHALVEEGAIAVEPSSPPEKYVLLSATNRPISIQVRPKGAKARRILVKPQRKSIPIRLKDIVNKKEVNSLLRKKSIVLRPSDYIGPIVSKVGSNWYYGYEDDVYVCDECGGPIVFRGYPPIPIHI